MNQIPSRESFRADADTDWVERPSRLSGALFQAKVMVFRSRRGLLNLTAGLKRLAPAPVPDGWVLLAEARSELWSETRSREHRHQRGKVENLRRATGLIGSGLLPAGQVFSFWRQIGKATRRRGFVDGRMIQEGCLVPSVGGGLCQLSNALYDVARRAGCEIVERHGHSKIVPGSAATHGDDATVAWNYVDLRFRHSQPLHIETRLTAEAQVVRIHGPAEAKTRAPAQRPQPGQPIASVEVANACDSCGQTACFRHDPASALPLIGERRVWLLDDN